MSLDQIILAIVYLLAVFVVFFIGKWAFDLRNRGYNLQHELLQNDNFALALNVAGYYSGLVIALGGVLYGPSITLTDDLIDIGFFGIIAIVLLNLTGIINDKVILYKFNNEKEIIADRNAGAGAIEGANYLASGLLVSGAISGEGDLLTAAAFWLLGQGVLIIAAKVYNLITPYDLHEEIERDNVAVGIAFAGLLVAFGLIIRAGIFGDFISWEENLWTLASITGVGLVFMPFVRLFTDKMLLPGARLTDELVNQEKPNVGAGVIEAFSYIAAALLLGWVL